MSRTLPPSPAPTIPGRLRYNGRKELAAIAALDEDVTDGSLEQSTTAVLDKISGAELIGGAAAPGAHTAA